jgi:hypothetical protein
MPHEELVWTDCSGLCEGKTVHIVEPGIFRCCTCGVSHEGVVKTLPGADGHCTMGGD